MARPEDVLLKRQEALKLHTLASKEFRMDIHGEQKFIKAVKGKVPTREYNGKKFKMVALAVTPKRAEFVKKSLKMFDHKVRLNKRGLGSLQTIDVYAADLK